MYQHNGYDIDTDIDTNGYDIDTHVSGALQNATGIGTCQRLSDIGVYTTTVI